MKELIQIFIIIGLFSSCKQSAFLTRKYTQGRFVESKRTLRHNTVLSDTTKNYASSNIMPNIVCAKIVKTEKEITEQKINSIFSKKDTIIRVKRRGPDKEIVIKSKSKPIHIFVDEVPTPGSPEYREVIKTDNLKAIKVKSILSLVFAIVPVLGFIIAIANLKSINRYERSYNEGLSAQKGMSITSLVLSILPTLAAVLIVLAFITLLLALIFGPGMFLAAPMP